MKNRGKKMNWGLFVLAAPGMLLLLAFQYAPLFGLVIPFKRLDYSKGIWGSDWVGFKNFEFFFKSQSAFRVTRNTMLYNFAFIVIGTVVAVALALMLFELSRNKVKIYQTCLFVPYFISWIVVSYVVYALLNPLYGLIPKALQNGGAEAPMFYSAVKYWPFILVVSNVWKGMGYTTLLYYATLMGIDANMFEAAAIDGANKIQIVFRISIPFLVPIITILTILSIGKIFNSDFGLFYFLPRNAGVLFPVTDTIDTYVYRALRVTGEIGMASAVGFYQSIVGFVLVLVSNLIVRRINPESSIF
ncbi:MAG: ABC transporter permease subunit [Treponema sp.]|jgi:putative aldouronate transport system permease protein|nr:ABC transporter permease subunit [Treponema sp.]